MAQDPTQVRVFGDGHIYTAPVSTTEPADISASVGAGWTELGYLTPAGPEFSFDRTTSDVEVWQSLYPVRTLVTAVPITVKMAFAQLNKSTLVAALGGGTVASDGGSGYIYTPPSASAVDERAIIVEGLDGAYTYRFIQRRAALSAATGFSFKKDANTAPEATWKLLDAGSGTAAFIIQTNDPAFS